MESFKEILITIRLDREGKVYIEFDEEGIDISLPDLLFLLQVAQTQVIASYYNSIKSGPPTK